MKFSNKLKINRPALLAEEKLIQSSETSNIASNLVITNSIVQTSLPDLPSKKKPNESNMASLFKRIEKGRKFAL